MSSPNRQQPPEFVKDSAVLLRMKELVDATGVPKSTVLHYVNEGLLPEPVRTSVNMAYYHPRCIERIRAIKTMQSRHRLPLSKIRHLLTLKDQGQDVTLRTELIQTIFGSDEGASLDEEAFCQVTGLARSQVHELIEAQLLLPLNPGSFDDEDVGLGTIFARGFSQGLSIQDLLFYPRLGKKIVDEEMALRRRLTHHLPDEADAARTLQLVQGARATRSYVIDRLFQKRVASSNDLKDKGLLS